MGDNKCEDFSTRGPSITNQWCIDCYISIACRVAKLGKINTI